MKALVIGGSGFIGSALVAQLREDGVEVNAPTRSECDLLDPPDHLPYAHVVYICGAMTRFIECEDNKDAYRVNVDGPLRIAEMYPNAQIVYLSSEAVERCLHTNYGHHKAMAELALRTVCKPIIVRLSKVTPDTVRSCADYLTTIADAKPGIYHWP